MDSRGFWFSRIFPPESRITVLKQGRSRATLYQQFTGHDQILADFTRHGRIFAQTTRHAQPLYHPVHFLTPPPDDSRTWRTTRSTMKQVRLNNCLLMHYHKSITNTLMDTVKIANGLLVPENYTKDILGNLSRGMRLAWCTMSPHVSKRYDSLTNFLLFT